MTITQRRLYLLFFIILFFLTAPVIVLFAKGYRFDTVNNIFVYSGSITIKSAPRDIDIYVDNKKQKKSKLSVINGSYTLNGIRPGKHTIACKKEGYTSWSKTINVHSGISTEFWNILLLPNTGLEENTFIVENVKQFFLSPRNNTEVVLFSEKDDLRIVALLNTEDNSVKTIYETSEFNFLPQSEKENVEWSSDNKRILMPFSSSDGEKIFIIAKVDKENLEDIIVLNDLFKEENGVTIKKGLETETSKEKGISKKADQKISTVPSLNEEVSTNQATIIPETTQIKDDVTENASDKIEFKQVRWMFNKNDELVILTKNHELLYVDIQKPDQALLLDNQVGGFDFAGNRIYYFHLVDNSIWEIKNNDIETKKQIASILTITDKDSFVKMVTYDQYRIAIMTPNQKLFLFNYEKEEGEVSIKELSGEIQDIQFSDDGKKLLYWSDNEIWYVMLRDWEVQPIREKGEKFMITRSSAPIYNVQWIEDYENIFFTIGDTVKSSGIDTRDHIELVNVQKNDVEIENRDVIYDKNTQLLYSKKSVDGQLRLHSSKLIDRGGFLGL
ncbi:PEGA domain-containing protein [bacterium]|nr:PEGA domain-containing protein [bacterium]MBT6753411.1 PEGA domain-containing protein [bacterium]MBT7038124.1 PEGA domain-containing protein [bacterium]MBT7992846.1 PEGA domain-containing protein [bacterium]